MVQQAQNEPDIIPGNRYVQRRTTAFVGKAMIGTGIEEVFGDSEFTIANAVDKSRVIVHGIPHVNLRSVAYQDHRCLHVVVGGGDMKGGDVLAMDVRVCTGFEKNCEDFGVIVIDCTVERRVVLEIGPVVGGRYICAHTVNVSGLACLQKFPTRYGLTGCEHDEV